MATLKPEHRAMVAQPTLALDLPLKVRAWFAADIKVWHSYNDLDYLQQRFSLSDELVKNIAVIRHLPNRNAVGAWLW